MLTSVKKTDAIDTQRCYRLRCSVPQPPKLYGLPNCTNLVYRCDLWSHSVHGSPKYQLSKYLTTILQPLTDKSRRKLRSTENFIDAFKTVQIPDDYKLVSFDVKSLLTTVFHFNWLYTVPRPLYNNPPLNYHNRQKTSWTY